MAEQRSAQEQYAGARKALLDVGQHGIAWSFDKAWAALREEHRADTQAALDKAAADFAKLDGRLTAPDEAILAEAERIKADRDEATKALRLQEADEPATPTPGAAGEGGGASSAAGSDNKSPLPGGVIA